MVRVNLGVWDIYGVVRVRAERVRGDGSQVGDAVGQLLGLGLRLGLGLSRIQRGVENRPEPR